MKLHLSVNVEYVYNMYKFLEKCREWADWVIDHLLFNDVKLLLIVQLSALCFIVRAEKYVESWS